LEWDKFRGKASFEDKVSRGLGLGRIEALRSIGLIWKIKRRAGVFLFPVFMTIYAFGSGDLGQLGLGDGVMQSVGPRKIEYFASKKIMSVAAGGAHNLVVDSEGSVYSWGCNDDGALGRGGEEAVPGRVEIRRKIARVAAGDSISVAIDVNGHVWAWGLFRNVQGILGFGRLGGLLVRKQENPVRLKGLKLKSVQCGSNHVVGVDHKGNVWSFGDGANGQLGRRVSKRVPTGGLIPSISLKRADLAGAGGYHSLAVRKGRCGAEVACTGVNNYGQAPGCSETFWGEWIPVPGVKEAKKVKGGEHCTFLLDGEGGLHALGRNDSGQLGIGSFENRGNFTKCLLQDVSDFDISGSHVLAISKGRLFSWGFGEMCQLGHRAEVESTPKKVELDGAVSIVGAGGQHSLAVSEE
jgi:regulator of chromosome condensation